MVLILAHHYDVEAGWLFNKLVPEFGVAATLLLPEALGLDYSVSLQLRNDGQHEASVFLYGTGRRLYGSEFTYVINRLSYIDPLIWKRASEAEKLYAASELNAFFPAFIHALTCPVSNPVYNGSLYGDNRSAQRWAGYFSDYGLCADPLMLDTTGKVFEKLNVTPPERLYRFLLIEEHVLQPCQQEESSYQPLIEECMKQCGERETTELIFLREVDKPVLLQAAKVPALSLYGEPLLNVFARQLNQTT